MSRAAHLLDRRSIFRHDRDHPWNGCGTITTDGSVILASWYTGGYKEPHPDNHVVLSRSFDGGATWEPPTVVSDPPGDLRAGDPMAWRDDRGVTHLTYGHHDQFQATGDWSYFHLTCPDLAAERLQWSAPARVLPDGPDFMLNNKTIALPDGSYLAPIAIRTGPRRLNPYHEGFTQAGALVSRDRGASWQLVGRTPHMTRSGYGPPDVTLWEPAVIANENGALRFFIRNSWGLIHSAKSTDGGVSWSEWQPTNMPNPSSRCHVRSLPGGVVIALNNPNAVMESLPGRAQRSPLALHVSYNGGDDFSRIVILDPGVGMYPDAELDPDGHTLHLLYEDRVDVFYAALDLNAVL